MNKKKLLLILVPLLAVGLATAGLLDYYARITGKAEVKQSVIVVDCDDNECEYEIGTSPTFAGSTNVHTETVENRANQQIPIKFMTIVRKCDDKVSDTCEYTNCLIDNSGVVTTRYFGELKLENKDANWVVIPSDGIEATLKYDLVSSNFNYELEATGLQAEIEYALIYYADNQNRFVNWGGDNPGVLIRKITSDENGYILTSGSKNLGMSLPHTDDWNLGADYSVSPDFYPLHSGAKIWLVPSSDYDVANKKLTAWNPTNYLFETDMIDYSNSDTFMMNTGEIVVNIENTFNPATEEGCYKVITSIVPA